MMDRISICEALAKRNEIDPLLKRMVNGDEKGVTYDNIVRKRSWSKRGEAAQTVAKSGLTGLPRVFFHPSLSAHVNKTSDPPEFLKQLALEVISNIPDDVLLIYTDGSSNEHSRFGSGIYIKSKNYSSHIKLRNSDGYSVFHSELIAINTSLKEALSIPGSNSIWILSDSRSVIQTLSNWHKVGDITGVVILEKLKHLSSREIHLQ
ncbi:gag-pol [Trichonephila clavipes]|nr:gag-pol [Trichonephila clavipes]